MDIVKVSRFGYDVMKHEVHYSDHLGSDEMEEFRNLNYKYYGGISSYLYLAATDQRPWYAFCTDHESLILAVSQVEPESTTMLMGQMGFDLKRMITKNSLDSEKMEKDYLLRIFNGIDHRLFEVTAVGIALLAIGRPAYWYYPLTRQLVKREQKV